MLSVLVLIRFTEHTRFVYGLNDSATSSEDDDSEYDTDGSEYSHSRSQHVNKSTRSKRASRRPPHPSSYSNQNSHSAVTRGKKRMSIVTNQWVDALAYEFGLGLGLAMPSNSLPNGGPASNSAERKTKRTFFESAARWDSGAGQVFVESTDVRLVRQRLEVNGSRRYGAIADVFANGKAHDGEGDEGSVMGDDEGEMDLDEDDR